MPSWPETLPSIPRRADCGEQFPDLVLRTPMDAGPPKVRRRFTAGERPSPMGWFFTAAQMSTFETWWKDTIFGGSLSFTMTNPRTGIIDSWRFTAPPAIAKVGGSYWHVTVQLEQLP